MAGSNFGTLFHISTWGESHGVGLGVVIDGCPAGLSLSKDDIMPYMNRRKPGANDFTTSRKEADDIEILSGVFNGLTTGTTIPLMENTVSEITEAEGAPQAGKLLQGLPQVQLPLNYLKSSV